MTCPKHFVSLSVDVEMEAAAVLEELTNCIKYFDVSRVIVLDVVQTTQVYKRFI